MQPRLLWLRTMKLKNPKAKGSRNEYKVRDELKKNGFVFKVGGSLGPFDLIALCPRKLFLVQVKSNTQPSKAEWKRLHDFMPPKYAKKWLAICKDRKPIEWIEIYDQVETP